MLLNALYLRNKNEMWRIKRQHNDVFNHINCIPQRLILLCVSHAAIWLIVVKNACPSLPKGLPKSYMFTFCECLLGQAGRQYLSIKDGTNPEFHSNRISSKILIPIESNMNIQWLQIRLEY